jgi:hypothetical protein
MSVSVIAASASLVRRTSYRRRRRSPTIPENVVWKLALQRLVLVLPAPVRDEHHAAGQSR